MALTRWFDDNRQRSYPFVTGTVGQPVTSSLTLMRQLPPAVAVDCGFLAGPLSGFVTGSDSVFLKTLSRAGSTLTLTFATTAAYLVGVELTFTRDLATDPDYLTTSGESGAASDDLSSTPDCQLPGLTGFLTTGRLADIAAVVPDSTTLTALSGDALVQPTLLQNLANSWVRDLAVANADRIRATAPAGCPPLSWPFPTGGIIPWAQCLTGDVRFRAGYNTLLSLDTATNAIILGARPGAGAGAPCDDPARFPDEAAAWSLAGSAGPLTGGLWCNEVLRSLNGVPGPDLPILAGAGVSVIPDPAHNQVVIDVNMRDLSTCFNDFSRVSESL